MPRKYGRKPNRQELPPRSQILLHSSDCIRQSKHTGASSQTPKFLPAFEKTNSLVLKRIHQVQISDCTWAQEAHRDFNQTEPRGPTASLPYPHCSSYLSVILSDSHKLLLVCWTSYAWYTTKSKTISTLFKLISIYSATKMSRDLRELRHLWLWFCLQNNLLQAQALGMWP